MRNNNWYTSLQLDKDYSSRRVKITLLPNTVHTLRGDIKMLLVNMHKYLNFILNYSRGGCSYT